MNTSIFEINVRFWYRKPVIHRISGLECKSCQSLIRQAHLSVRRNNVHNEEHYAMADTSYLFDCDFNTNSHYSLPLKGFLNEGS